MIRLLTFLIFIVSVAATTGGIVLASRLRNKFSHDIFSSLFYYQVFIYTFGFYGIWGQVVLKAWLDNISLDLLSRITDIATLLGFPFLVLAWLMLIRLSCFLTGMKCSNIFTFLFLLLNFASITVPGVLLSDSESIMPSYLLKMYYIIMNIVYSVAVTIIIWKGKGKNIAGIIVPDRIKISVSLVFILILQCIPLLLYEGEPISGLVFILVFFAGNSFLPFYLNWGVTIVAEKQAKNLIPELTFDSFCRQYEISPREKDIIREICNGLSNKEISEKLFISLQTVKDHTHRIYIKVNVRSRMQLMNLVKSLES